MIKNGARVIIKDRGNYKEDIVGCVGIVQRYYEGQSNIAVEVEGVRNNRSSYGYFYFRENQLRVIEQANSQDKEETIMDGNYRIAEVVYFDDRNVTTGTDHVACYDATIMVNDYVIINNVYGYAVAKVMELTDKTDEKITKEIVCKCDFSDYFKRCDDRKRRGELMKQMEKRASELKEIALYEMLAKEDPTMASMLEELRGIGNGN